MRKIYEAAVLFIGTLGWWGFVYPELCLDGEACQEEADGQDFSEGEACWQEGTEDGWARAVFKRTKVPRENGWQLGEIRIKSRLVEYVCHIKENAAEEKRLDDEG